MIQGPEDLSLVQISKKKGWHGRAIYDSDGDGIEDNMDFGAYELDKFYDPLVFGVAEDVHNTRHGNMPGHRQKYFYDA